LIAGNGDVGNLHYYKGKFEAYQRTYVLSEFGDNVSFLWHQLTFRLAESLGIGKIGSSIPYIKKGDLTEFTFDSPIVETEQTAIATVLSDMDDEIAELERRRDKTRAIKQGMMQQLLTGRVRLV
jgi:type I restriction enzyme S subunit